MYYQITFLLKPRLKYLWMISCSQTRLSALVCCHWPAVPSFLRSPSRGQGLSPMRWYPMRWVRGKIPAHRVWEPGFPLQAALLVPSDCACSHPRKALCTKTGPAATRELLSHLPDGKRGLQKPLLATLLPYSLNWQTKKKKKPLSHSNLSHRSSLSTRECKSPFHMGSAIPRPLVQFGTTFGFGPTCLAATFYSSHLSYSVNSLSYIIPVTICLWQALELLFYDYIQTLSHSLPSKDHLVLSYVIYNAGSRSSEEGEELSK